MSLTSQTKRNLIATAHSLKPVVIIGNQGLTKAVTAEIDRALFDHELIKIKVPKDDKESRLQMLDELCNSLQATTLKIIGHTVIIYRPSDKKNTTGK